MTLDCYQKLLEGTRIWYSDIEKIYCPALKADVIFNSKGFRHVLFDGRGIPRSVEERVRRLMLVRFAPSIIREATEIAWRRKEENAEFLVFRKQIKNNDGHQVLVRVIVKRTAVGNHFYYSVMDESVE